jgi:hypothetical protein
MEVPMSLPLIRSIEKFQRSAPAKFDGFWGWESVEMAFPGRIYPTDIDGLVERKGHFLLFETKGIDDAGNLRPIPMGQKITLRSLHKLGTFTILIVWCSESKIETPAGKLLIKEAPTHFQIWRPNRSISPVYRCEMSDIVETCKNWYRMADAA